MTTKYRSIPSVEKILSHKSTEFFLDKYTRGFLVGLIREYLNELRENVTNGSEIPDLETIINEISMRLSLITTHSPKSVINATGIIIHTNLGRVPLSQESIKAIINCAAGYTDLEFDLNLNRRGSRHANTEHLLRHITGAERAIVVNNNASALLVTLSALSSRQDVIVSRGEAVEIGGGFRIPDIIKQSGANLIEVGTTNRTYIEDYGSAITQNTGAILKVHTSNFKVTGFVHEPSLSDLVKLSNDSDIPLIHDLGSGCFIDTSVFSLSHEPTVQESIKNDVPLVLFSGDKLLGGPQSGIIIGNKKLVDKVSYHPTARAVRIDKLSIAGLNATLMHYLENNVLDKIPVWRMISASIDEIKNRALSWNQQLGDIGEIAPGLSAVGGGSLPGDTLPTMTLRLDKKVCNGPEHFTKILREGPVPVIARIDEQSVILDPRTVLPEQDDQVVELLKIALRK